MKSIKLMLLGLCVAFGAQQAQAGLFSDSWSNAKGKVLAAKDFAKKHHIKAMVLGTTLLAGYAAVCMTDMYGVTDSSTWMGKASSGIVSGLKTVRPWLNAGWNSTKM